MLLPIGKAAKYTGFSRKSLRRWSDDPSKDFAAVRVNGQRWFRVEDLDRLMADGLVVATADVPKTHAASLALRVRRQMKEGRR